jgi:hypothetical protein
MQERANSDFPGRLPVITPMDVVRPYGVSHGRGHWFDPSTAHHSASGRAWGVRQSDREPLTDGGGSLLDGL